MPIEYFGRKDQNANAQPVRAEDDQFNLRVRLDRPAASRIDINLNFQRLVNPNGDAMIETAAISDPANTYFAPGGFHPDAFIAAGQREVVIGPWKVRRNPTAGGGAIRFPADVLFTASVDGFATHTSHVVTIIAAEQIKR